MRLQIAIPESHVSADVLDSALEAATRLDANMVSRREVPTFAQSVKAGRVRWQPEPPGAERFDHAKTVLGRGWGDCDDLAPWHAGSLRVTGVDPKATAVAVRSGPNRWHAVVRRSDGTIEDPSRQAGMGQQVSGIAPAATPLMYPVQSVLGGYGQGSARPAFAVRALPGVGYEGRCDLPFDGSDYAMTALRQAPVAAQALVGAIASAVMLGECTDMADDEDVATLYGIGAVLDGNSMRDVVSVLGESHPIAVRRIVRVAPHLARAIAKSARPMARRAGHGQKSARSAAPMARMLAAVRL